MTNAMTTVNDVLMMWENKEQLQEIRKLFAPKLSDSEFQFFVGLGKASRLNPFTREIWAVKYQESQPAQVFIGRDGYRKAAQAHPEYDFHQADAVYENDEYEVVNGVVHHKYKLSNRGKLVGAYCVAKRHKSSRPIYVFCELSEYSTGRSLWNTQTGKPATMIKKVAESQCLRACFQDLLGGTYAEEEEWEEKGEKKAESPRPAFQQNDELKDLFTPTVIDEPFEHPKATDEQLKEIEGLFTELALTDDRITKALITHEVSCLEELTETKAKILIYQLNKLKQQ
jgi:phage recombination protein Bet